METKLRRLEYESTQRFWVLSGLLQDQQSTSIAILTFHAKAELRHAFSTCVYCMRLRVQI